MEKLNLNIFNLIILLGIIQGFIFGFIIIFNKKLNNKTNLFLAFTSFSLSISNVQYWFVDSNLYLTYPILNLLRIPTEFLIIPMFYLFLYNYLGLNNVKKKIIILLIPFLLDSILQILISINYIAQKPIIFTNNSLIIISLFEELFCFIYSGILIVLCLNLIKKNESNNFTNEEVKPKTKWLVQILTIGLVSCLFWIIEILIMSYLEFYNTYIFYPIWICITFIIYWLSYSGLIQSNIINERKTIRQTILKEINSEKIGDKTENLFEKFEAFILINYFNPNLSLELVAEEIKTNPSYLSQIINAKEIKFNDYVNRLRIEKAKKILRNKDFVNYTISAIGLEAGFNSNASFYRAFKKHTGITPKEFKNNISFSYKLNF